MFYYIFSLFIIVIIGIIYLSQNKDALQKINNKLKEITGKDILQIINDKFKEITEKQQKKLEQDKQLELLLQQLQKQKEPTDCVGSFDDWSECNIEKCDISNNINGIGKKTRRTWYWSTINFCFNYSNNSRSWLCLQAWSRTSSNLLSIFCNRSA